MHTQPLQVYSEPCSGMVLQELESTQKVQKAPQLEKTAGVSSSLPGVFSSALSQPIKEPQCISAEEMFPERI